VAASGIANISARDPLASIAGGSSIEEAWPSRYMIMREPLQDYLEQLRSLDIHSMG
jgi:hypothetical protein